MFSDTCFLLGFWLTFGLQRFRQKSWMLAKQGQPNKKPQMLNPYVSRLPQRTLGNLHKKRSLFQGVVKFNSSHWTLGLILKPHILLMSAWSQKRADSLDLMNFPSFTGCAVLDFCLCFTRKTLGKKLAVFPPSSPPNLRREFFLYEEWVCKHAWMWTYAQKAHHHKCSG